MSIYKIARELPYINCKIEADSRRLISTGSVLETSIVLANPYGEEAYREIAFSLFLLKQPIIY
jgi:uncharacterized protein with PIN domain